MYRINNRIYVKVKVKVRSKPEDYNEAHVWIHYTNNKWKTVINAALCMNKIYQSHTEVDYCESMWGFYFDNVKNEIWFAIDAYYYTLDMTKYYAGDNNNGWNYTTSEVYHCIPKCLKSDKIWHQPMIKKYLYRNVRECATYHTMWNVKGQCIICSKRSTYSRYNIWTECKNYPILLEFAYEINSLFNYSHH